jgi:sec-independent protein translocase protein TatA
MLPTIGPFELIVVLTIALLILGPKRLPAAGRSLGRAITEFRTGLTARPGNPAGALETETARARRPEQQDS